VFELSNYLPDSVLPAYEELRDTLVSWLSKLGIVRTPSAGSTSTESSHTRQAFHDAENELSRLRSELEQKQADVKDVFDVEGFGRDGEWKKLDGTCLEKESGESVSKYLFLLTTDKLSLLVTFTKSVCSMRLNRSQSGEDKNSVLGEYADRRLLSFWPFDSYILPFHLIENSTPGILLPMCGLVHQITTRSKCINRVQGAGTVLSVILSYVSLTPPTSTKFILWSPASTGMWDGKHSPHSTRA